MPIGDRELVEALLRESEGTTLDFKRDQYRFVSATDADKAKLLKDLLAFANAWRRSDSYILVGVDAPVGATPRVVGVTDHFDDAAIQQFVNSKTQRPLVFHYRTVEMNGLTVGLFHIPLQGRPFFLREAYGGLAANTVYLRRGSSTAIAGPDELVEMGRTDAAAMEKPILTPDIADVTTGEPLADPIELNSRITDRGVTKRRIEALLGPERVLQFTSGFSRPANLERDLANVLFYQALLSRYRIGLTNSSGVAADQVSVRFDVPVEDGLVVLSSAQIPEAPQPFPNLWDRRTAGDVLVETNGSEYMIAVDFGSVRPGERRVTQRTFAIGSLTDRTVNIRTTIFSRDAAPIVGERRLTIRVEPLTIGDDHLRLSLYPWTH